MPDLEAFPDVDREHLSVAGGAIAIALFDLLLERRIISPSDAQFVLARARRMTGASYQAHHLITTMQSLIPK